MNEKALIILSLRYIVEYFKSVKANGVYMIHKIIVACTDIGIDIEFLFVSSTHDTNVSHLFAVLTLMQYLLEHSRRNSISLCGHATVFFSIFLYEAASFVLYQKPC